MLAVSVADPLEEIAGQIAAESGLGRIRDFHPFPGGRNNRVARVDLNGQQYLLKNYFYSANDTRDRLNNEYSFVAFAWQNGCRRIAKPIFRSNRLRSALYEYIPGKVVNSRVTEKSDIEQAVTFVLEVNAPKDKTPPGFPVASEAGFSIAEHLENTARRIRRLSDISGESSIEKNVQLQVRKAIVPLWEKIMLAIHRVLNKDERLAGTLDVAERWLSPSDFGFHNAIEKENGDIVFIDFEFAGWDDPVKLICDFANQPDNILPDDFSGEFMQKLFERQPKSDHIQDRHRLLQPVFQLKWVCIILNHFLPFGKDRNLFTNVEDLEKKKTEQAEKMQVMLSRAELSASLI